LAVSLDDKVQVVPFTASDHASCVGLDLSGKLIVGQAAKNQLVAAPNTRVVDQAENG